eukprot:5589478-Amphidinium_carterae.1
MFGRSLVILPRLSGKHARRQPGEDAGIAAHVGPHAPPPCTGRREHGKIASPTVHARLPPSIASWRGGPKEL